MIDETKSRIPIWLLWARTKNNLVTLAAVALTAAKARSYRTVILRDSSVVHVQIEKSEANHLYNPDWNNDWEKTYGKEHLEVLTQQVAEVQHKARLQAERERDKALAALEAAGRRIAELEQEL